MPREPHSPMTTSLWCQPCPYSHSVPMAIPSLWPSWSPRPAQSWTFCRHPRTSCKQPSTQPGSEGSVPTTRTPHCPWDTQSVTIPRSSATTAAP